MAFDARITITGLTLLVLDDDTQPQRAELVLVDTETQDGGHDHHQEGHHHDHQEGHHHEGSDHRHYPMLAIPFRNLGNLQKEGAELSGWGEFLMSVDGRAISHFAIDRCDIFFEASFESETTAFTTHPSFSKLPDLRSLGITSVKSPDATTNKLTGATTRIALPFGELRTEGTVRDFYGNEVEFDSVGKLGELVHLDLKGLTSLVIDHGSNRFEVIPNGQLVEIGISNEPKRYSPATVSLSGEGLLAPHFHLLGSLTDTRPELRRTGNVTPGNPACPSARWTEKRWGYLSRQA